MLKQRALVGSGAKGQGTVQKPSWEAAFSSRKSQGKNDRVDMRRKPRSHEVRVFSPRSSGKTQDLRKWQPRPLKGQRHGFAALSNVEKQHNMTFPLSRQHFLSFQSRSTYTSFL